MRLLRVVFLEPDDVLIFHAEAIAEHGGDPPQPTQPGYVDARLTSRGGP